MGRNKYPEQTIERILDTSARLFIEKGYEQTSIQDILDDLKLSKGGLYHHFKSKEEILEAVMQKRAENIADMLHNIIQNTTAPNAKEKLRKIICQLAADSESHSLDVVLATQVSNPYFVANGLQICVNQDAPIICKLIEEGIKDGSLKTEQPKLCAEVFLLLLNVWANPVLFGRNLLETKERLDYLQTTMCLLGLDIIDNDFIDSFMMDCEKAGAFKTT